MNIPYNKPVPLYSGETHEQIAVVTYFRTKEEAEQHAIDSGLQATMAWTSDGQVWCCRRDR